MKKSEPYMDMTYRTILVSFSNFGALSDYLDNKQRKQQVLYIILKIYLCTFITKCFCLQM